MSETPKKSALPRGTRIVKEIITRTERYYEEVPEREGPKPGELKEGPDKDPKATEKS